MATHVIMYGGKFTINSTYDLDMFLKNYVEHIRDPQKRYGFSYVEQTSKPKFNFFLDLDIKEVLNEEQIFQKAKGMINKLTDVREAVISSSGTNGEKTGIHIQTNLPCTLPEAEKYISVLDDTSVDSSVYKTGLRMIWSHKMNNKKEITGQPYVPLWSYQDRTYTRLTDDLLTFERQVDILKKFSIRIPGQEKVIVQPQREEGAADYSELEKELSEYISTNIGTLNGEFPYRGVKCSKLKKFGKSGFTFLTDSHYCGNVQRNHESEHVYFYIGMKKNNYYLSQRCHCKTDKDEAVVAENCSKYKGSHFIVPADIATNLKKL